MGDGGSEERWWLEIGRTAPLPPVPEEEGVGDGGSGKRWWLEIGKNGPPSSCPGGGRGRGIEVPGMGKAECSNARLRQTASGRSSSQAPRQ